MWNRSAWRRAVASRGKDWGLIARCSASEEGSHSGRRPPVSVRATQRKNHVERPKRRRECQTVYGLLDLMGTPLTPMRLGSFSQKPVFLGVNLPACVSSGRPGAEST
eukprot:scaffold726_cov262-Pinguiococcus_pyrenoidosus.AAC.3